MRVKVIERATFNGHHLVSFLDDLNIYIGCLTNNL
jgi:hypothetical protein